CPRRGSLSSAWSPKRHACLLRPRPRPRRQVERPQSVDGSFVFIGVHSWLIRGGSDPSVEGFDQLVSGCPGVGGEFGDSIDREVSYARQYRAKVVANRDL